MTCRLALLLLAVSAAPAAARTADVNVVNTVSVTGTVGIDPAANVVRVEDTVPVQVANSAPVPVEPGAGERVQFVASASMTGGETSGSTLAYAVPEGKRLEIESVTVDSLSLDGVVPRVTLSVHWIDRDIAVTLPMEAFDLPDGGTQWLGTTPVRAVTDSFVRLFVSRNGSDTGGNLTGRALVIGRLLDLDAPAP